VRHDQRRDGDRKADHDNLLIQDFLRLQRQRLLEDGQAA
jgi:hypothetical protein